MSELSWVYSSILSTTPGMQYSPTPPSLYGVVQRVVPGLNAHWVVWYILISLCKPDVKLCNGSNRLVPSNSFTNVIVNRALRVLDREFESDIRQ